MKKAWSVHARPRARSSLSARATPSSVLGLVLGISKKAVTPPSAAWALPPARSSLCSRPGSRNALGVDHAGQDVEALGIEGLGGGGRAEVTHRRNLPIFQRDIARRDAIGVARVPFLTIRS